MATRGYVVECHLADGIRASRFATKRDAMAFGSAKRRAGVVAFVFAEGSRWRSGL